jgi:hypothetical protein
MFQNHLHLNGKSECFFHALITHIDRTNSSYEIYNLIIDRNKLQNDKINEHIAQSIHICF